MVDPEKRAAIGTLAGVALVLGAVVVGVELASVLIRLGVIK